MKRQSLIAALLLAWLATGAFASQPQQPADPEINKLTVKSSFDEHVCGTPGFKMRTEFSGKAIVHVFTEKNGNTRTLITQANGKMTFTNLDNGKTVRTTMAGMSMTERNAAGQKLWKMVSGNRWHLNLTGEGQRYADVGRVVWVWSYDSQGRSTGSRVEFESGLRSGNISPYLCEVLG